MEIIPSDEVTDNLPNDDGILLPFAQWKNRDCQWKGDTEYRGLIEGLLSADYLEKMKKGPFGKFMLLEDAKYSGRLINCFLQSQIVSSDNTKLSFKVFGDIVDFTADDFHVVSGLNISSIVDISIFKLSKSRLKEKYFRNPEDDVNKKDSKWTLKLYDLLDLIEHHSSYVRVAPKSKGNLNRVSAARLDVPLEQDDAVKLAELYLLNSVLLGRPLPRVVDDQHMIIIDNEEVHSCYQWGTEIYRQMVHHLQSIIKPGSSTYLFPGMPFLFCCWVAEVFPVFRQYFTVRPRIKPVMLRYTCTFTPQYNVLCDEYFHNEQFWEDASVRPIRHKSKHASTSKSPSKSTSKSPSKSSSKTSSTGESIDMNEVVKRLTANLKVNLPTESKIQHMINSSENSVKKDLADMEKRITDQLNAKFDALLLLVAKSKTSDLEENCGVSVSKSVTRSRNEKSNFVDNLIYSDGRNSFFKETFNQAELGGSVQSDHGIAAPLIDASDQIIVDVLEHYKADTSDPIDEAKGTDDLEKAPSNSDNHQQSHDKQNPSSDLLDKCPSKDDDVSLNPTDVQLRDETIYPTLNEGNNCESGKSAVVVEQINELKHLVETGIWTPVVSQESSQEGCQPIKLADNQMFLTPEATNVEADKEDVVNERSHSAEVRLEVRAVSELCIAGLVFTPEGSQEGSQEGSKEDLKKGVEHLSPKKGLKAFSSKKRKKRDNDASPEIASPLKPKIGENLADVSKSIMNIRCIDAPSFSIGLTQPSQETAAVIDSVRHDSMDIDRSESKGGTELALIEKDNSKLTTLADASVVVLEQESALDSAMKTPEQSRKVAGTNVCASNYADVSSCKQQSAMQSSVKKEEVMDLAVLPEKPSNHPEGGEVLGRGHRVRKISRHLLSPFRPFYPKEKCDWKPSYRRVCPFHTVNATSNCLAIFDKWLKQGLKVTDKNSVSKVGDDLYDDKIADINSQNKIKLYSVSVKSKMWFREIADRRYPLTNEHVDVILYYLRKKHVYHFTNYSALFTTTDLNFDFFVESLFFSKVESYFENMAKEEKTRRIKEKKDRMEEEWKNKENFEKMKAQQKKGAKRTRGQQKKKKYDPPAEVVFGIHDLTLEDLEKIELDFYLAQYEGTAQNSLLECVNGSSNECGIAWGQVEKVFMPIRKTSVDPNDYMSCTHYWLGVYSIKDHRIDVYDSVFDGDEDFVKIKMAMYAIAIPKLLKEMDFHTEYPNFGTTYKKLDIVYQAAPKQLGDTDCGIFVTRFTDLLMLGQDLFKQEWGVEAISIYRRMVAVNLLSHGKSKRDEGYETPPEKLNDDYGEHDEKLGCEHGRLPLL